MHWPQGLLEIIQTKLCFNNNSRLSAVSASPNPAAHPLSFVLSQGDMDDSRQFEVRFRIPCSNYPYPDTIHPHNLHGTTRKKGG